MECHIAFACGGHRAVCEDVRTRLWALLAFRGVVDDFLVDVIWKEQQRNAHRNECNANDEKRWQHGARGQHGLPCWEPLLLERWTRRSFGFYVVFNHFTVWHFDGCRCVAVSIFLFWRIYPNFCGLFPSLVRVATQYATLVFSLFVSMSFQFRSLCKWKICSFLSLTPSISNHCLDFISILFRIYLLEFQWLVFVIWLRVTEKTRTHTPNSYELEFNLRNSIEMRENQ